MEEIEIRGARIHNLKNINLVIPKHKLIVITGISGSGKSSLAFDILFEEGKNQYLRSIGILSGLDNEDRFDSLTGIGPAVAVRQNTVRQSNPRSTVGTKTGILNQLALLYAADGEGEHLPIGSFLYTTTDGMCMHCQGRGAYFDVNMENLAPECDITLLQIYERLHVTAGFLRVLQRRYGTYFDTPFGKLPEEIKDEVIHGTYENGKQSYCIERILRNAYDRGEDVENLYEKVGCPVCHGERVNEEAGEVLFHGKRIGELGLMTISHLWKFLQDIPQSELSQFSRNVLKNVNQKLIHLIQFRLGHVSLYRELSTLSGGELQRVFLHLHLESGQDSLIYVFDEPMSGLHPSEKQSMMNAMLELRDIGNTVIVVEHDREMIRLADHIIEIGPGAGIEGGTVVFQGSYSDYVKTNTKLTPYLSDNLLRKDAYTGQTIDMEDSLLLTHANLHYLKDLTVRIPLHCMVGIAGLSGSGKSSLIEDTLLKRLAGSKRYSGKSGQISKDREEKRLLSGAERINGFVKVSQEPIGRNAGSTPASYIGIWDRIRELFALQPKAIERGMTPGHFSFHSRGACPECSGSGYERIFLTADFSVDKVCPVCHGRRYKEESLDVTYEGRIITDILAMNVSTALLFFHGQGSITKPLQLLEKMGMGYLTLGQPTSSLSGGEAQRIKLIRELGKQHRGNMLYVLDEPSTGLSMYDIDLLLEQMKCLVEDGNSVIVIEHNTDILKNCDYIIELGPEGGELGGSIIAEGTPGELIDNPKSRTGRYLL